MKRDRVAHSKGRWSTACCPRWMIGGALLAFAGVLPGGCATDENAVVFAGAGSPAHDPRVIQRDGRVEIFGLIEPRDAGEGDRVVVTVIGPDGTTLFEGSAKLEKPERRRGGPRKQLRGPRSADDYRLTYRVEFEGAVPPGSVVRVSASGGSAT